MKTTSAPHFRQATFPVGHGIMILPWDEGTAEFEVNKIHIIKYNLDDKRLVRIEYADAEKGYRAYGTHENFDDFPAVVQDMHYRAKMGEIASYKDYNKDGSRIDGTPLFLERMKASRLGPAAMKLTSPNPR